MSIKYMPPSEYQTIVDNCNGASEKINDTYEILARHLYSCMEKGEIKFQYTFDNIQKYILHRAINKLVDNLKIAGWSNSPIFINNNTVSANLDTWLDNFNSKIHL